MHRCVLSPHINHQPTHMYIHTRPYMMMWIQVCNFALFAAGIYSSQVRIV